MKTRQPIAQEVLCLMMPVLVMKDFEKVGEYIGVVLAKLLQERNELRDAIDTKDQERKEAVAKAFEEAAHIVIEQRFDYEDTSFTAASIIRKRAEEIRGQK